MSLNKKIKLDVTTTSSDSAVPSSSYSSPNETYSKVDAFDSTLNNDSLFDDDELRHEQHEETLSLIENLRLLPYDALREISSYLVKDPSFNTFQVFTDNNSVLYQTTNTLFIYFSDYTKNFNEDYTKTFNEQNFEGIINLFVSIPNHFFDLNILDKILPSASKSVKRLTIVFQTMYYVNPSYIDSLNRVLSKYVFENLFDLRVNFDINTTSQSIMPNLKILYQSQCMDFLPTINLLAPVKYYISNNINVNLFNILINSGNFKSITVNSILNDYFETSLLDPSIPKITVRRLDISNLETLRMPITLLDKINYITDVTYLHILNQYVYRPNVAPANVLLDSIATNLAVYSSIKMASFPFNELLKNNNQLSFYKYPNLEILIIEMSGIFIHLKKSTAYEHIFKNLFSHYKQSKLKFIIFNFGNIKIKFTDECQSLFSQFISDNEDNLYKLAKHLVFIEKSCNPIKVTSSKFKIHRIKPDYKSISNILFDFSIKASNQTLHIYNDSYRDYYNLEEGRYDSYINMSNYLNNYIVYS